MSQHPHIATPWPRGLSREQAASYVGIGTTLFDQLVSEGKLPEPLKIRSRKIWDIRKLDSAFDSFGDSVEDREENPWDS